MYITLFQLWITEKMSPTLEAHKSEFVDCMLDQLQQMTNNLKKCKSTDLKLPIHKMEVSFSTLIVFFILGYEGNFLMPF